MNKQNKVPDFKGLGNELISISREAQSIDGGELQDLLVLYGLLKEVKITKPCGEKNDDETTCLCAEVGDFPMICYQKNY